MQRICDEEESTRGPSRLLHDLLNSLAGNEGRSPVQLVRPDFLADSSPCSQRIETDSEEEEEEGHQTPAITPGGWSGKPVRSECAVIGWIIDSKK